MSYLAIALLLFFVAIVLFFIDLSLPTGGVLAALAAVVATVSIVIGFQHSQFTGLVLLLGGLIAIPLGFWAFVELWPKTPFGKRMIVTPAPAQDFAWSDAKSADRASELVGRLGVSLNEMLPSGKVMIDDRTYEAFSESGPIDKDKEVQVIRLDVGRLVVIEVKNRGNVPISSEGSSLDRPASELSIESLDG